MIYREGLEIQKREILSPDNFDNENKKGFIFKGAQLKIEEINCKKIQVRILLI